MNSLTTESAKHLSSLSAKFVKQYGVAYTPTWIASHITNEAFNQWRKFNAGKKPQTAADICCGTGVFLNEIVTHVKKNNLPTKVSAFDVDRGAIKIAKNNFNANKSVHVIESKDVLLDTDDLLQPDCPKYDIIVGNPPYVSHKELNDNYKLFLSKNYDATNTGAFDLSVIFVEKILNSLTKDGIGSVILSNKFMTAKYGKAICEILSSRCNVIKIEHFNDLQLFDGLTTYTCIITFSNSSPAKKHTLSIADIDTKNRVVSMPRMKTETILHKELEKHPWNFHTKDNSKILKKFKTHGTNVLSVFEDIQQGVRTGANDVFLIDAETEKKLGTSTLIKSFVSGENIVEYKLSKTNQKIIYPYESVGGAVQPISQTSLKKNHKSIYQYLNTKKITLEARSLQGSTNWFEYSRSQSLNSVYRKKILIREMMPKAVFSADVKGEYVFSSGYALIGDNLSAKVLVGWAAILSTPTMEFFMRHIGTQLHSGWFRLMKNHITELFLPSISDKDFTSVVNEANKRNPNTEKINSIVASSFKLTKNEMDFISTRLHKVHQKSAPKDAENSVIDTNRFEPVKLSKYNKLHIDREDLRQAVTFSQNKKIPIHNWYKFTQGFSPNLVNTLIDEFNLNSKSKILDPFNGCGTTTAACAYRGIPSIGIEISPLMCTVAEIKTRNWDIDKLKDALNVNIPKKTSKRKSYVFEEYLQKAYSQQILNSIKNISDFLKSIDDKEIKDFYTIGLLSILEDVSKIRKHGSHYRFLDNSNSVGLQKLNIPVIDEDTNIFEVLSGALLRIYNDICTVGGNPKAKARIVNGSGLKTNLKSNTIDSVITSPPYLNRNNYISQQKAELDVLELISNNIEYKNLVKSTFRSHTDSDLNLKPESKHPEINRILHNMELESGNNPKIPNMICGYFDDLEQSIRETFRLLKKGGKAAYVVGNTRWGGVVVPIDHLLAKFAEESGFQVDSIFVTRHKGNSPQQMKRFGRIPVRESIVIFSKN